MGYTNPFIQNDQAEQIRLARQKCDMTQAEFASFTDRHTQTISAYETGIMNPSKKYLQKIKKINNSDPTDLLAEIESWRARIYEVRGI